MTIHRQLFCAHVVRAAACERGYTYTSRRCRNKIQKKEPLWACTKSGTFSEFRTAKPKTALRFCFCIISIFLISERGRRRTDYLRAPTVVCSFENGSVSRSATFCCAPATTFWLFSPGKECILRADKHRKQAGRIYRYDIW